MFCIVSGNAYNGPSVSGCTGTETEKQIGLWERRVKGLRRMILGWDQTKPPDPPYLTAVDVTGPNSVLVRIQESSDGPIATKFKGKLHQTVTFNQPINQLRLRLAFNHEKWPSSSFCPVLFRAIKLVKRAPVSLLVFINCDCDCDCDYNRRNEYRERWDSVINRNRR